MTPFVLRAGDPRAARGIGTLAHGGGAFLLPLLGAVGSGLLSLVFVSDRDTSPSALRRALDGMAEPVALILDGDDYAPGAPSDWRCTAAALAWARIALVHGAAGTREHYEIATLAAAARGRLLLVHCSSSEALAWAEATARLSPLVITPKGGVHPLPLQPEGTFQ